MSQPRKIAEAFPLCEHLQEEMEARGWSETDVAERCALSADRVKEIIGGARMELREAAPLGHAFSIPPYILLNLQTAYSKWLGDK